MHSRPVRAGRTWETVLALLFALAAGGAGGYLLGNRGNSPSPAAEGQPQRIDKVTALGRLQPAGGVVPVYGPPGDRIARLFPVAPGRLLEEGEPIAELASRGDRLKEVQISETQQQETATAQKFARIAGEKKVQAARAELEQSRANKGSDIASLEAKEKYVQLQAKAAGRQVERLKSLRKSGVTVAEEDLEKAELVNQAEAELAATQATIRKTLTTYEETEKAATARIAAAQADLDEALARVPLKSTEEKLELARQVSNNTSIKAPITGTVLKVIGREGMPTGINPILQMADLAKMTAVAEVYESDVPRVVEWLKQGPVKVEVKNPALTKPLAGVVSSDQDISRMIARNQVFAMGPREDADRRIVEVVAHLDAESAAEAGRFVGLQVTVTLEPAKGKK
jgi:HlyD family secretion protein